LNRERRIGIGQLFVADLQTEPHADDAWRCSSTVPPRFDASRSNVRPNGCPARPCLLRADSDLDWWRRRLARSRRRGEGKADGHGDNESSKPLDAYFKRTTFQTTKPLLCAMRRSS
jgi:hypothetical protein